MQEREAVLAVLATPVEQLAARGGKAVRAQWSQLEAWGIDLGGRGLLAELGIPQLEEDGFEVAIQPGNDPETEGENFRVYRLGFYFDFSVGLEAGSGKVLAISSGGDAREVYVNSSIGPFVDIAWHWFWARHELGRLWDDPRIFGLQEIFLRYISALDGPASENGSFWHEIVTGM